MSLIRRTCTSFHRAARPTAHETKFAGALPAAPDETLDARETGRCPRCGLTLDRDADSARCPLPHCGFTC